MKLGSVVLVRFPFSDLEATKKRPALVLTSSQITKKVSLITIAMITSQIEGLKFPGDCLLSDWEEAGLLHPSLVRLSKVATVDLALMDKELGRVSADDLSDLKGAIRKLYRAWCS